MINLEGLYFEWLLRRLETDRLTPGVEYVSELLHNCVFERRVGRDINRAADGANLRKEFLREYDASDFEPHVTNELLDQECSWLEMLVALAVGLDFLYEGGVYGRYYELVTNLGLRDMTKHVSRRSSQMEEYDQRYVRRITSDVDHNRFQADGHGGLFPLSKPGGYQDQRRIEIWDQHSAYFREKLEGVLF